MFIIYLYYNARMYGGGLKEMPCFRTHIKLVNNMKLMILEKIRVIRTCSSSPRAASVYYFLCIHQHNHSLNILLYGTIPTQQRIKW